MGKREKSLKERSIDDLISQKYIPLNILLKDNDDLIKKIHKLKK